MEEHDKLEADIEQAKQLTVQLEQETKDKRERHGLTEERINDIMTNFEEKDRVWVKGDARFLAFFKDHLDRPLGGDYLKVNQDAKVSAVLFGYGDEAAVFADYVIKVNRRNAEDRRILALGEKNLYLLNPDPPHAARRVIGISNLDAVCVSQRKPDLIILRQNMRPDTMLYVTKRSEVLFRLIAAYELYTGKPLHFVIGDSFGLVGPNHMVKDLTVKKDGNVSLSRHAVPNQSVAALEPIL